MNFQPKRSIFLLLNLVYSVNFTVYSVNLILTEEKVNNYDSNPV